jgi:hypothetical protein
MSSLSETKVSENFQSLLRGAVFCETIDFGDRISPSSLRRG